MRNHLAAFLFLIACFTCPAFAGIEADSKRFPLPQAELEGRILGILDRNHFEIVRSDLGMGRVKLRAVKARATWEITLTPDSPLATQVDALYRNENEDVDVTDPENFWQLIANGVLPDEAVESQPANLEAPQRIPSVILSKIEAVVCIRAGKQTNRIQLTGFIVSEAGLILCTAHDLRDLQEVEVLCYDGVGLTGNVIRMNHELDLALVQVERTFDGFIDLAEGRNLLGVGETVYSVGCPVDLGGTVYRGVINGPPRHVNGLPLWQVQMEIHHGSSGSPVFDLQATLVGIVKGRYRGTDSIGFLIPLETIMDFAVHVGD